jgi:hypothetical protein
MSRLEIMRQIAIREKLEREEQKRIERKNKANKDVFKLFEHAY